jgi:hypothetical protein
MFVCFHLTYPYHLSLCMFPSPILPFPHSPRLPVSFSPLPHVSQSLSPSVSQSPRLPFSSSPRLLVSPSLSPSVSSSPLHQIRPQPSCPFLRLLMSPFFYLCSMSGKKNFRYFPTIELCRSCIDWRSKKVILE